MTIGSLASLFGLRINFRAVERLSLFHSSVLLGVSETELGLLHAALKFLSILFVVIRKLLLAHVRLVHGSIHLVVGTERKVGLT